MADAIKPWRMNGTLHPYKPVGCLDCRMTGYLGRVGIYETMVMTPELRKAITDGIPATTPDGQGQASTVALTSAERIEVRGRRCIEIRGSEIATMFQYQNGGFANLFNLSATASLYLALFADYKKLSGDWERLVTYDIFNPPLELFSLSYRAPFVQPVLARQSGSTLYINAGPTAADRLYFNTEDNNEKYIVSGSAGTVNIEFDGWYQTYTGVTKIVTDLGEGDDSFDASRLNDVTLDVKGGAGNDKLTLGSAGGTRIIWPSAMRSPGAAGGT